MQIVARANMERGHIPGLIQGNMGYGMDHWINWKEPSKRLSKPDNRFWLVDFVIHIRVILVYFIIRWDGVAGWV